MSKPDTRRGVVIDFDLARLDGQSEKSSGKVNTGNLPFMALELLGFDVLAWRRVVMVKSTPSVPILCYHSSGTQPPVLLPRCSKKRRTFSGRFAFTRDSGNRLLYFATTAS
ncbi:uncharacterized protein EI90DRAFT_3047250 [Cantharellus anzutake]|uniref:uncharacterized protein n=1 Tax=Cantharellus anzutake TaxID=1750568 RepID=UPI0019042EF0|nr:uncharacterized protein EI90DRAFT_3047250 [Cantharellus anzutake]KAF8335824.1 hypothetical protein EI90DRAFT_3047250 [Cantharellus anzutake]